MNRKGNFLASLHFGILDWIILEIFPPWYPSGTQGVMSLPWGLWQSYTDTFSDVVCLFLKKKIYREEFFKNINYISPWVLTGIWEVLMLQFGSRYKRYKKHTFWIFFPTIFLPVVCLKLADWTFHFFDEYTLKLIFGYDYCLLLDSDKPT